MIKSIIKKIPIIVRAYRYYKSLVQEKKIRKILKLKNNQKRFVEIYNTNFWGDKKSVSGPGSNIKNTNDTIITLKKIIHQYNIKSILDIPCGDFSWMQSVMKKSPHINYCGIDIVDDLIKKNNQIYSNLNIRFFKEDIINKSIPKSDLVICRDFLIHLSNKDIKRFLLNLKLTNFKYLLINGYEGKSTNIYNKEIMTGDFREINIFRYPLNLSKKYIAKFEDHKFQNIETNYKSYLYLFDKRNMFKF